MTRWRNAPQKKEQEEVMARDLINTDISKMSETDCRTIIRILNGLGKSIVNTRESLTREIKELKTSQKKIKNAVTEMQIQLDAITTRMEEAKELISDTEDKVRENNEAEKKERKNEGLGNSVTP